MNDFARKYNEELKDNSGRKYSYEFDCDVMHPYMIKSFEPFFKQGNLLELGSSKGIFTKRFLPFFEDITCVDASDEAIAYAKRELNNKVKFLNSTFETLNLESKYNNIVMTHVLEHLDNPVLILKRINDEWLNENGRFFWCAPTLMRLQGRLL